MYTIKGEVFPDKLKKSKVIPLYQKEVPSKKENYRPFSLLCYHMDQRLNSYTEDKLSKYITGLQKAHRTQHEKGDKGEYVWCLFMDFSIAFDRINHKLLLA